MTACQWCFRAVKNTLLAFRAAAEVGFRQSLADAACARTDGSTPLSSPCNRTVTNQVYPYLDPD